MNWPSRHIKSTCSGNDLASNRTPKCQRGYDSLILFNGKPKATVPAKDRAVAFGLPLNEDSTSSNSFCYNIGHPFAIAGLPVVKLHFLGTTGYHPNEKRQTACLMIPERGIIFDAGTGIFRARDLICTKTLDIFMSHVHLDHSIGLTFLYDVLWGKDIERITVHVDASKISAIEEALYHKDLFPVGPNFELKPLQENTLELADDIKIRHCSLQHPGGSNGFRMDHPSGSMAYITDTVASLDADYIKFISGVDVLVHECYFPDGWEDRAKLTGHSCLTPVAQVAAAAGAGSTYLVHINPLDGSDEPLDLDSVKEIYADLNLTEDRMVIDL